MGQKGIIAYLPEQAEKKLKLEWGESISKTPEKHMFAGVKMNGQEHLLNDVVSIESKDPTMPHHLGRIVYFWKDSTSSRGMFHAALFVRGSDTVLGEAANANELFVVEECQDLPLSLIVGKVQVLYRPAPENWATLGGQELPQEDPAAKENIYYYKFKYSVKTGAFTVLEQDNTVDPGHPECLPCQRTLQESHMKPKIVGDPSKNISVC